MSEAFKEPNDLQRRHKQLGCKKTDKYEFHIFYLVRLLACNIKEIGKWNVSNVTDMGNMFNRAYSFNQPLGDWNVSSVTSMMFMFREASSFNQPIGNWDVSSVTNMSIDVLYYAV